MHYQPQFKQLACKHCGALSTYCLAELINNQKTIMSTDYQQLRPWRSDGEDINLFTQNHSDQSTWNSYIKKQRRWEHGRKLQHKKYIYSSPPASRVWLFHIGAKLCKMTVEYQESIHNIKGSQLKMLPQSTKHHLKIYIPYLVVSTWYN